MLPCLAQLKPPLSVYLKHRYTLYSIEYRAVLFLSVKGVKMICASWEGSDFTLECPPPATPEILPETSWAIADKD